MTDRMISPRHRRIGELAADLSLNPKTIRYYEELGLLPAPGRTPAGYRMYGAADRERLVFIGKAKAVGLTLGEIGDILAIRRDGSRPCETVLALIDQKLAGIEQQMRNLSGFREGLLAVRQEAAETMTADACVCGIIEQHATVQQVALAMVRRR